MQIRVRRNHLVSLGMVGFAILGAGGLFLFDAYRVSAARKAQLRPLTAAEYSRALRSCTIAGPRTHAYVARIPSGPPLRRLAALYQTLLREWRYRNDDAPGADTLLHTEALMAAGLAGDCEDWAIALCATAEAMLGLRWRITTTVASGAAPAHAYPEVLVCERGEDPRPILEALARELGVVPPAAPDDDGTVWVAPDRDLKAHLLKCRPAKLALQHQTHPGLGCASAGRCRISEFRLQPICFARLSPRRLTAELSRRLDKFTAV